MLLRNTTPTNGLSSKPCCYNGAMIETMGSIAARIRVLMDDHGWNPTDLSRELERVRPDKFSESWRVQVVSWLNGSVPNEDNAQALAAVFGVDASVFRRSQMSEAEEADLRRLVEQAAVENSELRRLVADLQRKQRRTQELPKPGSERQANG